MALPSCEIVDSLTSHSTESMQGYSIEDCISFRLVTIEGSIIFKSPAKDWAKCFWKATV
jgi:hypothetical protein